MDPTYGRAKAGRPARTYIQQLNSKIIKGFVPEQRSRYVFSNLEIPMFYVYMLPTFVPEQRSRYVFSNLEIPMFFMYTWYQHSMSISHMAVSGYGKMVLYTRSFFLTTWFQLSSLPYISLIEV